MRNPESPTRIRVGAHEGGNTQAAAALDALRADILGSKLAPGTSLVFSKLKADYGVGLSPLREALSRLAAGGLVYSEGQRGFFVANASLDDFNDISMLRQNIEGLALRKSIELGDDAWEANVVAARHGLALLERGSSKAEINDDLWELRHREFHDSLISGSNSPWLMHIADMLADQFDRYRRRASKGSLSAQSSSDQHQEITDAALDRKADLAVSLLHDHIKIAVDRIATTLTDPNETSS